MSEILGLDLGLDLSVGGLSGFMVYILWIFGFLVLAAISGVIIWKVNNKKLFSHKIVLFEYNSGTGWTYTRDVARKVRLAADGTFKLFLKKNKFPLKEGRKMSFNETWYAKGDDGNYYNFVLGDLDAIKGILDIEPVDRDVKHAIVNTLKEADKEYGPKKSFMEKYGVYIFSFIIVIVLVFAGAYLVEQMGNIATSLSTTSESLRLSLEHFSETVKLWTPGSSGIVSVE